MLRFGFAFGMLGIAASSAMAAQVTFKGTLHVTAVNATCAIDNGAVVGMFSRFRFSPPGLGDNGPSTRLSNFYSLGFAENYTLPSGSLVGTTYQPVVLAVIGRGGGLGTSQMRITSQIPAVPTTTTSEMKIVGNIKDFSGDVGCNIGFIANGFKE